MTEEQRAAALRLADRVAVFDDSLEVATNVQPLDPYWGPEAFVHITGMWDVMQQMGKLLRALAAEPVAAAAKPRPLSEDQLWKAVDEGERAFVAGGPGTSWTLCVARAIEAAHGIGGEE